MDDDPTGAQEHTEHFGYNSNQLTIYQYGADKHYSGWLGQTVSNVGFMDLLKRKGIDIPILMLTMHQSIKRIRGSLERGAQGYILKDASREDLVEAIQKVSQRQNYFHPKINDQVFDYFRGKTAAKNALQELSKRQIEIIRCLSNGMNTKAIADELFISVHTVKTHRRNIMQKLRVSTSAELVKLAMERELI